MKHITTLVLLIMSIQFAQAQLWIDVGVKGGYGMSLLANNNIFNDASYNHQFTAGNGFGGRVGLNFGENHGFTMDVMSRKMKQNFEYTLLNDNTFYTNTISWKNLDLYLLYRYSSQKVFIEFGPMLSLVRSVEQVDDNPFFLFSDVEDYYSDKYYSAVLGFGGFLVGNEVFSLNFGVRIHYALQDFISEEGQSPPLGGLNSFPAPIRSEIYSDYKETRPVYIEVGLELSFGLGEFARTSCSNRRHWFWSGNR